MGSNVYNLTNLKYTDFCILPSMCVEGSYLPTIILAGASCLADIVLVSFITFKYNNLDLASLRYFGPLVSNGTWIRYFEAEIVKMVLYVVTLAIDNEKYTSSWCVLSYICCILTILTPAILSFALFVHLARKMRNMNSDAFQLELRSASKASSTEHAVQAITVIVSVAVCLLVCTTTREEIIASDGPVYELEDPYKEAANLALIILLVLTSLWCLVVMILIALRSDSKKGFSKSSRVFMCVAIPFNLYNFVMFILPCAAGRNGQLCFGPFSPLDVCFLLEALQNVMLFLFIASEHRNISDKMVQVFMRMDM